MDNNYAKPSYKTKSEITNEEYEKTILNVEELPGTDIKITPAFYIHNGMMKAQEALVKEDAVQGFAQYRLIAEHLEVVCEAANLLPDNYEEELTKFKETPDFKEAETQIRSVRIATKKIGLMMRSVFAGKVMLDSLKI